MDSNFQVKITVDISDLQKRVSSIEKELSRISSSSNTAGKNIKASFDSASTSIEKVGLDMNRARMATFAFGQVIRDAGFFQQSFGLGILAISNNIPILIDQLALASGVSAGFASAISLVGSVLTAGLTIFAYWAQSVERDGGSVSGAIKKMALDSQSSLGQLVDYLSKPPASDILNSVIGGVMTGFEQLKGLFNAFVNLVKAIWNRFGSDIESVTDSAIGYLVDTLKNQFGIALGIVKAFTAILSGDLGGVADAVANIFKAIANQIINILTGVVKIGSNILGGFVGLFSKDAGNSIKSFGASVSSFGQSLKFNSEQTKTASFNLKDYIKALDVSTGSTKKAKDATKELNNETKENLRLEANKFAVKLQGIKIAQDAAEAVAAEKQELEDLNKALEIGLSIDPLFQNSQEALTKMQEFATAAEDILVNGLRSTLGNAAEAIGNAIATGGNVAQAAGVALLQNLGNILSQLGQLAISTGLAIAGIKKALQSLNPAVAIAAGIALMALAGFVKGKAASLGGSMGGGGGSESKSTGSKMSVIPFANGGIVSGPTPALVGEYPGARSNPEVIAPLDKLQGILAASGGGMMTGTLETRISGNDLVILMNRATKNRNSYY